ncbi:MAG: hypothetical protein FJX47_16175, partial [Alphaproteobacteria bacterium]|nr:hypothetical protein [Alphaproteobacteria bacterium]
MSQAIRLAFALGFAGLTLLLGGCPMPVEVPRPGALPIAQRDDPRAVVLPDPASIPIPRPLAPGRRIDLPSAGATGLYGVPVLASLDRAYRAVSRGDMRAALAALDDMEKTAVLPIDTWYAAFYRAHALNLWGRVPEAERWAKISTEREIALRRTDINSRTLLGDAKSRLGDVEGAIADYMSVVRAIGAWRFPTFYAGPPANLDELSGMAEAATRAYIGLAFLHSLKRDHVEARRWAAVAERHLADVFSVREHALYGPFVGAAHPDLFLARAANLAFLGASELAIGDSARANAAFATARSYFDAIGYAQGEAYVEALTGLGLLAKRDVLAAKDAVDRAAAAARRTGLIDFIWRIEAIKGEAFLAFGLPREAEHAYRQAQGALDAMVGVLPTDRDKRRFGVGKDDITYHLARLAFERGDAEALFGDLERGRARAFVDMLATVDLEARPEFIEVRNSSRRVESAALGREMGEGTRGIAVVDKTIDALLEEHAVVVERLRQRDPVAAEAVGVTVPALTAIRARLGAEGALLYFLPGRGEDPVRALIAKASGNELRRFSITEAQLAAWLAGFAQAVKGRDAAAQKSLAAELSSSLGVRQWSAGGAHVVPSGTLHHVPWGALDVAGPVAVLPTAGWLLRPSPAKAAKAA